MTRPLPIACTLAPTEMKERGVELRRLGADALLDVVEEPARAVLRFRSAADVRERLEAVVAAESECCAFLDFRLDHGDDASVLVIAAPNGGAEVVSGLAAAFAGG